MSKLHAVKVQPDTLHAPKRLDIGCGQNKQPAFKGIDLTGDADIIHDLFVTPWPIKGSSVTEVFCSHFVEHIPHYLPHFQGEDGWWVFFEELYRVMRKGGSARFIHPYCQSGRAFWDPTHVRFISEVTWNYLDKGWRVANGIDHYVPDVDFEIVTVSMNGIPDDIASRNEEFKMRSLSRDWNVIMDLDVVLRVRK